jgi:hypothetical protein
MLTSGQNLVHQPATRPDKLVGKVELSLLMSATDNLVVSEWSEFSRSAFEGPFHVTLDYVKDLGDRFSLCLRYAKTAYAGEAMMVLLGDFTTVLQRLVHFPDASVSELFPTPPVQAAAAILATDTMSELLFWGVNAFQP